MGHRTSMFWDAGGRTFRRDRVLMTDTFLGVATSNSRWGARTLGLVEAAVAGCLEPFTRPTEVFDMLVSCSAAIADANRDPTHDTGQASITLIWEKLPGRVELAQCGGGHVLLVRDATVTPLLEPRTLARLAREHGTEAPRAPYAMVLTTNLGLVDPQIDLASLEWREGDRIVLVSASCDLATDTLLEIVRTAPEDVAALAGGVGTEILKRTFERGVTVIAQELHSTP
jgi:hypothetical protein